MENIDEKSECYHCIFKREVTGNCHITCINPDVNMTGDNWGVSNGWFMYPVLYDPVWKTKKCTNFIIKTDK